MGETGIFTSSSNQMLSSMSGINKYYTSYCYYSRCFIFSNKHGEYDERTAA